MTRTTGRSSEEARTARARALRFALDRYSEKKAAEDDGGKNARKEAAKHVSRERSVPRTCP